MYPVNLVVRTVDGAESTQSRHSPSFHTAHSCMKLEDTESSGVHFSLSDGVKQTGPGSCDIMILRSTTTLLATDTTSTMLGARNDFGSLLANDFVSLGLLSTGLCVPVVNCYLVASPVLIGYTIINRLLLGYPIVSLFYYSE